MVVAGLAMRRQTPAELILLMLHYIRRTMRSLASPRRSLVSRPDRDGYPSARSRVRASRRTRRARTRGGVGRRRLRLPWPRKSRAAARRVKLKARARGHEQAVGGERAQESKRAKGSDWACPGAYGTIELHLRISRRLPVRIAIHYKYK